MPAISDKKREKIIEQVLYYLFSCSPDSRFTSDIAKEIARDEEFIKSLLEHMKTKGLVSLVNKNSDGLLYKKRQRWRLSNEVYSLYAKKQASVSHSINSKWQDGFEMQ